MLLMFFNFILLSELRAKNAHLLRLQNETLPDFIGNSPNQCELVQKGKRLLV